MNHPSYIRVSVTIQIIIDNSLTSIYAEIRIRWSLLHPLVSFQDRGRCFTTDFQFCLRKTGTHTQRK
ncbi:hypothetical protein GYMLUDRAFT_45413 [Collybiopsis luxurians FD-317 M1]|uniref:Uncharacterized protein n=1 Tax=Collybiopsis luxurians FD-317 M1 TaxID=944289 RepID=A0A0D0BS90_9AGAR|nr:hypothetical protein GYMLUDRAFT_45413 [Collybiopsis luxurians FD-317 M1]